MAPRPTSTASISGCWLAMLLAALFIPALSHGQVNVPKNGYYLGLGDSISAGEGALPVTYGFVYRLYDHAVFGSTQETEFSNIAIRAAQTRHVLEHQVPQAICITGFQPNVVTITIGANDFFAAVPNVDVNVIASIAFRTAEIVNRLLNGFIYPDVTSPGKSTTLPRSAERDRPCGEQLRCAAPGSCNSAGVGQFRHSLRSAPSAGAIQSESPGWITNRNGRSVFRVQRLERAASHSERRR